MARRKEKTTRPQHGEKWRIRSGETVTILHSTRAGAYGRFYRIINLDGRIDQVAESALVQREGP